MFNLNETVGDFLAPKLPNYYLRATNNLGESMAYGPFETANAAKSRKAELELADRMSKDCSDQWFSFSLVRADNGFRP